VTPLLLLVLAQPANLNLNTAPIEVRQSGTKVPSRVRQWAVDCSGGATCTVDGGVWYLNATAGGGGSGLPADPAACPAGQFVIDQNAFGVLTCGVPDAGSVGVALQLGNGAGGFAGWGGATCASGYMLGGLSGAGVGACVPQDAGGPFQPAGTYVTSVTGSTFVASSGGTTPAISLNATGTPGTTTFLRGDNSWQVPAGGGGGAPTTATYITQTADATLSAEQALSTLATGVVKVTTTTGVLSTAVAGTDYAAPTSGSALLKGNGLGGFASAVAGTDYVGPTTGATLLLGSAGQTANYAGAACGAGTYVASTSAAGALTCTTPPGTYTLPDATSLVTGGVRLTGDLGGTAVSPAVVDDSHAHTGATISALDTTDITTGTLAGARGGLGAAQATCAAGDFLTCNGTSCSCSTPAGGGYTLPAATASVLGGVRGTGTALTCAGTTKATGFDATGTLQCGADLTGGGGGGGNWGSFAVFFGGDAGISSFDSAVATVPAVWVTGVSDVVLTAKCSVLDGGVTSEECSLVLPECSVVAQVASTSFDVRCLSEVGGFGPYFVSFTGAN
jgi:hypothetical protein